MINIKKEFKQLINKFCIENYNEKCDKFCTYCDWELYWRIEHIQVPITTVISYYNNIKDKKLILKVNTNNMLLCWRIFRNRFKQF